MVILIMLCANLTSLKVCFPFPRQTAHVNVSILLEASNTSGFLATRVDRGGCGSSGANGVFFWISGEGKWEVTSDLGRTTSILHPPHWPFVTSFSHSG